MRVTKKTLKKIKLRLDWEIFDGVIAYSLIVTMMSFILIGGIILIIIGKK